jgi:23S rRNA (cytosine1962-C5)-methyltransferase
MTNLLPTVLLKPGEADRVLAGHPWIYQGSILRLTRAAADGEVVQVKDHRQRFLGVGLFNSKSKIHVRLLSRERTNIDQAFFERRLREALSVRARHCPGATSFRVVNAEADGLSGLILDRYEDAYVLQTSALGMDQRKAEILAAVQTVFAPRVVLERNDVASRKFEGLAEASGVLFGPAEPELMVRLNGLQFVINLLTGHKTGLYLDQQVNCARVAEFVRLWPEAQVLDCFSFLGGFGLHAARAGAARVHLLDQSEEALAAARRNAERNGLAERCSFETANVFDWLKAHTMVGPNERVVPRFDLIILDPPSFTRNRASVPDALRGYKEIHLRALKLLKPGGILATFCCSHHIGADLFQDAISAAAFDAHRCLRRVATFSQSPDHPILPAVPETEYLKGFAFEILQP